MALSRTVCADQTQPHFPFPTACTSPSLSSRWSTCRLRTSSFHLGGERALVLPCLAHFLNMVSSSPTHFAKNDRICSSWPNTTPVYAHLTLRPSHLPMDTWLTHILATVNSGTFTLEVPSARLAPLLQTSATARELPRISLPCRGHSSALPRDGRVQNPHLLTHDTKPLL